MPITAQQLLLILPNARSQAGVFVFALNTAMQHYQIVGTKRIAAFIAQIGHESGQLRYVRHSAPTKVGKTSAIRSQATAPSFAAGD
jgi:putative chitinase